MKKTILFLMMAAFTLAATAQKKDSSSVKKTEVKKEIAKDQTSKEPTDTLVVDVKKVRFLKFGEDVKDLTKEIPLFVSFDWIIKAYDFFDTSKSGASKREIEQAQLPLAPYWQLYIRQLQQQQAQQKK